MLIASPNVQAAVDAAQAAQAAAEAAAAAAAASAAASAASAELSSTYSGSDVSDFPTRAAAMAASISPDADYIRTAGYAEVGDGGGALYVRVVSEPTHEVKFQSADAAWWELVVEGGEVSIEQVGGKADWNGTTGTDNHTPLMDFLGMATHYTTSSRWTVSPDVRFGVGKYYFSETVELKTIVRLVGSSTGHDQRSGGSNLYFPIDTPGFIVHIGSTTGQTGPAGTNTTSAEGSMFSGLTLLGQYSSTQGTSPTAHGIQMRGRATIRDCQIYNFSGDAIHIEATAGSGTIEGNANCWRIDSVFVQDFGQNGLYVGGKDANAGVCTGFETKGNTLTNGCGIFEKSSLGNQYFGVNLAGFGNSGVHYDGHRYILIGAVSAASSTTPGTDDTVWYPRGLGVVSTQYPEWSALETYQPTLPIFSQGETSNASVFAGIYVEGTQYSHLNPNSIVIGGSNAFTNTTPELHTIAVTGITPIYSRSGVGGRRRWSEGDPGYDLHGDSATVSVGSAVGSDPDTVAILQHTRTNDAGDYIYQYSGDDITYFYETTRITTMGTLNTEVMQGRPLTPPRHKVSFYDYGMVDPGNSAVHRQHGIRAAIPTAAGEYAQGEVRWSYVPKVGGAVGWVCTTTGALANAWVTGTNYSTTSYILATNTKYYKCTTDGGTSSTVEPSHASGEVVEADGFGWTHVSDTAAVWQTFGQVESHLTISTDAGLNASANTGTAREILHTGTLTANRSIALSTTGAWAGLRWRISRTGAGNFLLNVGTGPLIALKQYGWCEVVYDGSAWYVAAYGRLRAPLEATATVDPASLATGASTTIATIAVTGAVLGDIVKASFSLDLAGATLTAWVSAADTVSYFFTNVNGANPLDLLSGTLKVQVER